MRELKKGEVAIIKHTVVDEDIASFQGNTVHKVCSTFALAREIEWSSRQFVIQNKEEFEEGIGTMLTVNHKSPAFIGEELHIEAIVDTHIDNELICSYTVKVGERLVAYGKTGQKVLNKSSIEKIFSKFEANG